MELLLINKEYFVAKCVLFKTMSLSLVDFEQELEQYDLNCKKMRFDGDISILRRLHIFYSIILTNLLHYSQNWFSYSMDWYSILRRRINVN